MRCPAISIWAVRSYGSTSAVDPGRELTARHDSAYDRRIEKSIRSCNVTKDQLAGCQIPLLPPATLSVTKARRALCPLDHLIWHRGLGV